MAVSVRSTAGKVTLSSSFDDVGLTPDEARRLAVSLIEHAARTEKTTEADTWF